MAKEECIHFVKKVLAHAMARDGSSGGVIRTVVIEEGGITRDFTPNNKLPHTSWLETEFEAATFVPSGESIVVRDDGAAVVAK
jgi:20S proteasome subunit beta 1